MRLSAIAILAATFTAAAALCAVAASISVRMVEQNSAAGVERRLEREGIDWAGVDANGLQVFVHGTAPDEAARFRAISAAGKVVDAARVIDETLVAEPEAVDPPHFSVEILRNDSTVSLIGLVPAEYDRARLIELAGNIVGDPDGVSDLLETARFPVPDGWGDAMQLATLALEELPRAKISAEAGQVAVQAMTDSAQARREVQADLEAAAPEGTRLALDLSAPRPVLSPFTLRFVKDDAGTRFDACSADTEEARAAILEAARAAGAAEGAGCVVGLGVPSRAWSDAAVAAIGAVDALGGGQATFSNADVSFIAPVGTPPARFDDVTADLEAALPDGFVLDAVLPEPPDPDADRGPVEFSATLSPEGRVQLRGRIDSEMARTTADSYARARFGSEAVSVGARIDDDLPDGWSARVLAALEALSMMANGAVTVTPESIAVRGDTGNPDASAEIAALLSEKLGTDDYDIEVAYLERLDPTLGIPTPAECVDQIRQIIGARKITFEPGSAVLDGSTRELLDEVADLLKVCGEIPLEIQGHTDSQGREVMNEQLSQERAQAVLDALRQRRVLTASYRAVGYGEAEPIADNDTEAGREANRRIEFRLDEAEDAGEDAAPGPEDVEYPVPTGDEAVTEAAASDAAATSAEEGPEDEQD
ncbi:Peptidoglycan-binding protein ArfA [Roseivivax jejudonensis]|uniref:Peptidoglycan-binding protein ArfA n=1 Tax=Roseivivax jejudonensis TaxID=1529041 RepID=A0A1X6ZR43_9RHOB|nr:OmpA family protein [Roseivivax jejudonensis]SLN59074.1 Peptidoglycan-binding protein ArfA [Roseivivax jejudonensis]